MDESTVLMLLTDPISSDGFAQLSFGFSLTVLQMKSFKQALCFLHEDFREPVLAAMLAALPSATPTDDNVDTVIATALARATRGTPLDFRARGKLTIWR